MGVTVLPDSDIFLGTSVLAALVLTASGLGLADSGLTAPFAGEPEPLVAVPEGRFSAEFLSFFVSACLSGLPGVTDLTGLTGLTLSSEFELH